MFLDLIIYLQKVLKMMNEFHFFKYEKETNKLDWSKLYQYRNKYPMNKNELYLHCN